MNKKILTAALLLLCFFLKAQEDKISNKIVLLTDSIQVYGSWYPASHFSHSYFICLQEFDETFSTASFDDLNAKIKKKHSDISVYKSSNNKSVTCIFPKHTLEGIKNMQDFVSSNFDQYLDTHVTKKKTVHVQVAPEYDIHNKAEEKGFKGFN